MKPENSWMCWTIPARRGTQAKRINSRLSSGDLQAIRTRALQAGIPDQTLISSILNQIVSPGDSIEGVVLVPCELSIRQVAGKSRVAAKVARWVLR